MNNTRDVILVNRCNQSDEFRTVLPAKMCVRVLLILMLAAAAVLVVGAGVGAAATTWHVDDDGGEGIDYMKIQDAVGNASEGDTIIVYGGTYREDLIINTRLILKGIDHPVIDANGSWRGVMISADGCIIDGFNITGSGDSGIRVYSDHNMMSNNNVYDNKYDGIKLNDSNHNIIANNRVLNNSDDGIDIDYSFNNTLINNIVRMSSYNGIELDYSDHNTIANNSVINNSDDGIDMDYSFNNTLINNTVEMNRYNGICFDYSDHNTIRNNSVFNNYGDGIDLDNSSSNIIANNSVFTNYGDGIDLDDSFSNIITNNIVYANDDDGIDLDNSSDNQIYNNNLIDNDEPASDDGDNNSWDVGPTVGGNYWRGHACTGNPSNGAQPYYIDADSIDHYPFADPIGELPPLPPPVPRTNVDVIKAERLSTSDTYIDHNQQYNFDIEWSVGVWNVKNLDNMTITITTPIDITYCNTWELYNNGSEICSVSPFTHTGDNYTWALPLKDRFASSVDFYLPEKTVQSKPWADMVVNTMAEGDYTRVNVTVIPRTASVSVGPSITGKIIDFSYPPEFEVDIFFPDHYIDFDGDWEDMNQGQSYNFSILVDEPKKVGLWLDKTHGSGTEYSDRSTVSVSELGSVMVEYEVPVKWKLDATYPEYAQSITITMDEGPAPHQIGDLNSDNQITPADAAIALQLAASGAHNDAADVSGDGQVTSLDALMILQAAAGGMSL